MEDPKIHRCEYVNLLVEAEYIIWLAENSMDCACANDLATAIRNYKTKRLALVQKFNDNRASA